MEITFTQSAWSDYLYWQQHDKRIVKKINTLIADIQKNPTTGLGKPEPLKYQLNGYYSRLINQEHRLVYQVTKENILHIISVRYHYEK